MTVTTQSGPLEDLLDTLSGFVSSGTPVLSLYLDARPNERGRDAFAPFLRKEVAARARSYPLRSNERKAFEEDAARMQEWLANELDPATNGAALFACSPRGLFETLQLEVPFPEHRLHVATRPHLYPLALVLDEYRRYAALVSDTNFARIFVFGLGRTLEVEAVKSPKTRRSEVGGWSQMRYQRHADNLHQQHAQEVVDHLTRVVREERVEAVVLAGDEVVLPLLRERLPKDVAARIIDVLHLGVRTPEHEVLAASLESLRRHDARTDAETVQRLLDEFRGGGLATAGARETLSALAAGQVDELVLSASPQALTPPAGTAAEELADELVTRARQTSAAVRFVEDPSPLADVEGVAAWLRFRLTPDGPAVAADTEDAPRA